MTYAHIIFVYFLSIVFLGAFFLINLTLAVINASFTKSQKEVNDTKGDKDKKEENNKVELAIGEIEIQEEDSLGISQFFIAKRAARKMKEFVKLRRDQKERQLKIDMELASKMKQKLDNKSAGLSLKANRFPDSEDTPAGDETTPLGIK